MAAIHLVYFDTDDTDLRAEELRSARYAVDECWSVGELADCLRTKRGADQVRIADAWNMPAEGALALARGLSRAPITTTSSVLGIRRFRLSRLRAHGWRTSRSC